MAFSTSINSGTPVGGLPEQQINPSVINPGYMNPGFVNPVVSLAAPLMDMALSSVCIESLAQAEAYRQCLLRAIKTFESNLKSRGYAETTVLVARYLVCAFIDEMLLLQPWANDYAWQDKSFAWQFSHKTLANKDFFNIIENALTMPVLNVDLLELGYVCLSLGFQGKYRYLAHGQQALTVLADHIYDTVRGQRAAYSRQLLVTAPDHRKRRWLQWPSKRVVCASVVLLLLGLSSVYYYRLLPFQLAVTQSMQTLPMQALSIQPSPITTKGSPSA